MPFLAALPAIMSAVGAIAGRSAGSKSDQRMQESDRINSANRNAVDLYGTQQGAQHQAGQLDLQRKGFSENARGGRTKQAVIGDLLANLKDIDVSMPGITNATVSGGLRPSAMGATGKAASAELAKQALMKLLEGDTFEGGKVLAPPQMQGMPQASGLEKFLNAAGLIGSLAGGVGETLDDLKRPKYMPGAGSTTASSGRPFIDPRSITFGGG